PILSDLTPHATGAFVGTAVVLTVKMSHVVRVATDVAISMTGDGSLASGATVTAATATVAATTDTATFTYYAPAAVPADANQPVINASRGGVTLHSNITVSNAPLTIVGITPSAPSVLAGGKV